MDKVDKLYANYDILADPNSKPADHEAQYLEILHSVKGENNEKTLACQFIPRFFKDFPHLADAALDAQLDLVEDLDMSIRKQALKHLPSFCKDSKCYVTKIADILAQMLQSDDSSELSIVHSSLMTILKLDVKQTLSGLFGQILSSEEEIIRKRNIAFLCNKLKFLPTDMVTKDVEEYILQECKKVLQDSTGEEFSSLIAMLSNLKVAKTIPGQQALLEMIMEQAELDKEFNCSTLENTFCLLQCIRNALPFLSPFVGSAGFVNYICLKVLPKLKDLGELAKDVDICLELIKLLAEITPFATNLKTTESCVENVFETMLEYMPLPPAEGIENDPETSEPNFQFTHIECLIYTFHQLARNVPDFLTAENADRLKDLKVRLQYLARSIQGCMKTIRESSIEKKGGGDTKADENKLKLIALRTMGNINNLIKDLFRSPPSFKTVVTLSWKPIASAEVSESVGTKRKEIRSETEESYKQPRRDWKGARQLYAPPGGKYSANVNKFGSTGSQRYYEGGRRGRNRRFY